MLEVADESPGPGFNEADSEEARQRRAIQYALLEERLNALQGVRSVALSWLELFSASDLWTGITGVPEFAENPQARVDFVSSRYFETVGMELVRGRGFTNADRMGAPRVAVINEAMSRRFFGDREPLGRLLGLDREEEQDRPFTVVGIVRDSRYNSVRETETLPMMWMPLVQAPYRVNSVTLRTGPGAPPDTADRAAAVLRSLDPYLMVRRVTTLEDQVRTTTAREWLLTNLSWAFGACALLLTAIGLYGTLAYSVAQRTREIGVRMALGAMRGSVIRMFLREAVTLAAMATLFGIPLALAAASSLRGFLFGVAPQDPPTMVTASAVLGLTAIAAACIPALRASRIEPSIALKGE
jgi:predicted permease